MTYISTGLNKDPNDTAQMLHRFQMAKDADWDNRRRGLRNMAAYMNDIVPNYLKSVLNRQNIQEQNFNILMYIVRGHVGNVLMNWFDPKFTGREGEPVDAIEALGKVYLAQKEYYDYKASAMVCYENGYVYRGVEQLVLDRPSSNPRSWGLKFVSMRPDMVVLDQNVTGDRLSRDSEEAWIIHYLSPSKMIRRFGEPKNKVEREILRKLQRDSKENPHFDTPTRDLHDNIDQQRYGTNYRMIEWMHIEHEKVVQQYLKNGTPIPSSGYEIGTIEDVMFKKSWAESYGFELSDDMILTMNDNVPCLYNTVFAPDIGVMLDDRKDFRQLGGHIPLYSWSFLQKNGMSLGIVDFEWDIQQDFNKRELAKTKIITKTPIAGKLWIRRDMYDSDTEFNQAVKDYTDSSKPLVIPESAPPVPEGFGFISGANFPPSILQDESFKLGLADRIGMLPPAVQGRSERSADSGIAIGRKVIEANTMMKQESTTIIQHENDKHEDWVKLAIKLFGHPVNMNRPFQSADGKDSITINEAIGIDPVGNTIMRNNIGSLKRVNVIISQTKENDFVSQVRMEKSVASLQAMPPSDTNILNRAAMEYTLVTSQDFSTDEDKERAMRLAELQLKIIEAQGMAQLKQAEQMAQGPQQPPMPQGAPQGQAPAQEEGLEVVQ